MLPLMKKSVSVHHPNTYTGLKDINLMFLSINIKVNFVINTWMEFKEQNQLDDNGIDSLIQ